MPLAFRSGRFGLHVVCCIKPSICFSLEAQGYPELVLLLQTITLETAILISTLAEKRANDTKLSNLLLPKHTFSVNSAYVIYPHTVHKVSHIQQFLHAKGAVEKGSPI